MAYTDDASIPDEERLLRRIHPDWIVPDATNPGQKRVSSAAFSHLEMSVDIASVRLARGEPLTATLAGYDSFGLVTITAGNARAKDQAVCRDPLPDNSAHGLVVGKKTRSVENYFKSHCLWVVTPR